MSQILIGTSGYDYPEWKGVFYPADLKRKDFLSYYASQFNALELNSTFYNMPTADRLLSFYNRADCRLQFSVKANRLLTHEVDRNWQTAASDFKAALKPLLEKTALSSVLFQLPESFHYTPENRIYLSHLLSDFDGFPTVVEFRHREWIRPSGFEGLAQRETGIVYCDMPQLKNLPDGQVAGTPFIGPNAYIRLHGRNADAWYAKDGGEVAGINGSARYCYDYSDDELQSFVPVVKFAVADGKKVHVYFNNHPNGSGAKNAKRLKELLTPAGPDMTE